MRLEPFENKGVPVHTIKGCRGAKEEVPTQQIHVYALFALLLGNMFWYQKFCCIFKFNYLDTRLSFRHHQSYISDTSTATTK